MNKTTLPKLSDRHLADLVEHYTEASKSPDAIREYTLACALAELQELRAQAAAR